MKNKAETLTSGSSQPEVFNVFRSIKEYRKSKKIRRNDLQQDLKQLTRTSAKEK